MQAFLAAWLDQLSWTDSLRLGAACSSAREALGADGVAAAAFALTRPWRAKPEASLRLWRRAWEACSNASCALGLRGGAWLKTATVIPQNSPNAAVTLDSGSARVVAEDAIRMPSFSSCLAGLDRKLFAILLMSGQDAVIPDGTGRAVIAVELQMLLLLEDCQFAVATLSSPMVA